MPSLPSIHCSAIVHFQSVVNLFLLSTSNPAIKRPSRASRSCNNTGKKHNRCAVDSSSPLQSSQMAAINILIFQSLEQTVQSPVFTPVIFLMENSFNLSNFLVVLLSILGHVARDMEGSEVLLLHFLLSQF